MSTPTFEAPDFDQALVDGAFDGFGAYNTPEFSDHFTQQIRHVLRLLNVDLPSYFLYTVEDVCGELAIGVGVELAGTALTIIEWAYGADTTTDWEAEGAEQAKGIRDRILTLFTNAITMADKHGIELADDTLEATA